MIQSAFAQSISGNLKAAESGSALRYGNVDIYKKGKLVASVLTDKLGNFSVALDTGRYECVFDFAGYKSVKKEIHVKKDEVANFSLSEDELEKKKYEAPVKSTTMSPMKMPKPTSVTRTEERMMSGRAVHSLVEYDRGVERISTEATNGSGRLTAGEINDFSKWEMWQKFSQNELSAYREQWQLSPSGRYSVLVQNEKGLPIVDATVQLLVSQRVVFTSKSDNTGRAECWLTIKQEAVSTKESIQIRVQYGDKTITLRNAKTIDKGINHQTIQLECQDIDVVDVAFVVDATGSMGDEISFLQAEMNEIMFQSKSIDNKLNFRFANVFYRDFGDEYLFVKQDFTRVLTEASGFINLQSAGGGGDYPEAMDTALHVAINQLGWSEQARSRILFLVLDAPPHGGSQTNARLEKLIQQAAEKGIRIVPIAASGIDKSTEYVLRSLALGTNGTYTFLTNHSGIGNHHIEPTTDKYDVETLSQLLIRIIKSYTYMPDCQSNIPELNLDIPDSLVIDSNKRDSLNQQSNTVRWSYYPNPTSGLVNIIPDSDIKELYITDLSGKILQLHTNLKKDERIQVDLSAYTTGIYLIRYLNENDRWISGKVVLQKGQ